MITNVARDVRAFTSNAFLVAGSRKGASGDGGASEGEGRTVLVDTGANFDAVGAVRERVDDLDAVVLTHTHPDHVGTLETVTDAFGVDAWGFDPSIDGVDRAIDDGERVQLGEHEYVALHTPGHKDDHLCFHSADAGVLFAGDLVFQDGGFGRTDLDEGDRGTLIESIDRVLERIDPDLEALHAGHGPSVTTRPYEHVELASRTARQA